MNTFEELNTATSNLKASIDTLANTPTPEPLRSRIRHALTPPSITRDELYQLLFNSSITAAGRKDE